jgi:hypothetical protein
MRYVCYKEKRFNCKIKSDQPSNWRDVINNLSHFEEGWRLPAIDELEAIYEQLHITGVMVLPEAIYWSSSEFSDDVAWYFDFKNGMDGTAIKKLAAYVIVIKEVT